MKKRVLIAVALVLAVVLIAQTGVWAGKLQAGSEAPAAAPAEAGARPQGTADGDIIIPVAGGLEFVVVDYTGDVPDGAPDGAIFLEGTESGEGAGATMVEAHVMEVELGPDGGTVSYWNGSAWIELAVTDGKVTIPAGAPNPVILAAVSG